VSLQVAPGELVVLQGLNGAGKSTLLKSVMGLEVRTEGHIRYRDPAGPQGADLAAIERWDTHRRAQAGLGYVAEDRRLFTELTVRENLRIAAGRDGSAGGQGAGLVPRAQGHAGTPRRADERRRAADARDCPHADDRARILLLDEPCEGIAPVLVEAIRDALLALRRQGLGLLVAEQNQLLAARADRLVLLVAGKVRGS
jgi:branched-chain amino acid transport system ATP-binding protein